LIDLVYQPDLFEIRVAFDRLSKNTAMKTEIFIVLKEYYALIHGHEVKARLVSPIGKEDVFIFETSLYYKDKNQKTAHESGGRFNSYQNAERHLFQYLDEFQTILDVGGAVVPGKYT